MWKEAVYISDLGTNTVLVQESAADNFRPFIQDQRISAPRGLAVDATFLYIADPVAHQIFAVNRETKEITRLLPDKTALVPIDVQLLPSFVRAQNKLERTITLAALDEASKTVSFITPFSPPDPASTSTDFPGPVSLSQANGTLFLADHVAKTLYQRESSDRWIDIRSAATVTKNLNQSLASKYGNIPGYFFPEFQTPQSAAGYLDFLYVVDDHKLFAYLPSKDRLVRLTSSKKATERIERVAVSADGNQLLLAGAAVDGFQRWPILVPMTVEVEPGPDAGIALTALYEYLWSRGTLPIASIPIPSKTADGHICTNVTCLVESVRGLLPQTPPTMITLVCELNVALCSGDKLKGNIRTSALQLPDVPFERYLASSPQTFDGKTSVADQLGKLIDDDSLLKSVRPRDLNDLNPTMYINFAMIPARGVKIQLPVQRNRYYLSAERSEIYSTDSGLLSLIKKYPNLSLRPYGASSEAAGQASNQSDVTIHDLAELNAIHANLLKNIGFDKDHLLKYGRANDVPILIYEAAVDCQHPNFFGTTQDDHAFTGSTCAGPEPATNPVYLDWTMTPSHHGTCVASLIGGRASTPYGPSLAPGADLNTIDSGSLNGDTLKQFYRRERQPFVVNYSSGDPPVTESQWRGLLQQPFVRNEVLLVAAADNDDDLLSNQKKFPAYLAREYANVVSVGALDKSGKDVWEDSNTHQGSNTGKRVELLAPGEEVPCAAEVAQGQAVYSTPSGTSFAAPLVSSVAALLLEKRLSPREVKARLLATADPMGQKERNGEPYALFGKLNVEDALSNPKVSHIKFLQNGTEMHLDADLADASIIKMQNPSANLPSWIPVPIDYLLSIRKATGPGASNMFKVVMFDDAGDSGGTIQLKDRVLLDGCLKAQSRDTGEVFMLVFGAGCLETQMLDQNRIINDLQLLIAPTLGPVHMQ